MLLRVINDCRRTAVGMQEDWLETVTFGSENWKDNFFFFLTFHVLNEEMLTSKENDDASVDLRSKPLKMPYDLNYFSF